MADYQPTSSRLLKNVADRMTETEPLMQEQQQQGGWERERRRKWQNELCWWCSGGSMALSQYRFSSVFSLSLCPTIIVYILRGGTFSLNFIIPPTYFNSQRRMFICGNSLRQLLLLLLVSLYYLLSVGALHGKLLGKAMNEERASKGTATWRPFIRQQRGH